MKTTHIQRIAIALSLVCAVSAAFAQQIHNGAEGLPSRSMVDRQKDSLVADHKIIYIDGKPETVTRAYQDSLRRVMETFYYDQFTGFSDPAAPYFMFMSRDASLAMGIGGCVRIRGWYDWDGAIPANGFSPYLIPMTPDPGNMKKLGATPAGSTLFYRVIGRNSKFGEYQLYIEANFNGYGGSDFHLKKAYAQIRNVTFGYAASTFSDPAAIPPTVDASGPNNKISSTNILVRYMRTVKTRWTLAASLEIPSIATTQVNGSFGKASEWLPEFAAFAQYAWGKSEHVRLAGMMRNLPYLDIARGKTINKFAWGAQLSAVVHPTYQLTAYGTINCGKGHQSEVGDFAAGTYDLVVTPDGTSMYAPFSYGWNLGLQYNFLPNLFASVSYADNRYCPRSPKAADEYKYGNVWMANVFWNLTPRIQAGLEFDTGVRKNFGGDHRRAQRVGAMAQFSF